MTLPEEYQNSAEQLEAEVEQMIREQVEEYPDNGSQRVENQFSKFLRGNSPRMERIRQKGAQLDSNHYELLDSAFREQVWPDELQKSPSWTADDDVTSDVQEWVGSVLEMEDPVWDDYSNIPMAAGLTVKQELKESLTQHQGWSLNSIDRRLRKDFPHLEPHERQRIARQETAGVLNRAKIVSLILRPDDPLVKWVGPDNDDTTELCTQLKDDVGDGVPVSVLLEKLEEYAEEYENGTPERVEQGLPHWLCRHTIEVVDQ